MTFSYLQGARGIPVKYSYDDYRSRTWLFALFLISGMLLGSFTFLQVARAIEQLAPVRETSVTQVSQIPQPTQVPSVAPLAVEQPLNSMQKDIETWVSAQSSADWAVSVRPISGATAEANYKSDTQFELASIYKLFLLQPLAQRFPSSTWATTQVDDRTYSECIFAILSVSNNPCAIAIAGKLGWGTIDRNAHTAGYSRTQLNRSAFLAGTVSDTAQMLENLYRLKGFDQTAQDQIMAGLAKPKSAEGIRRGCNGCKVWNKTGDLSGLHHDAAIVEKEGRTYAVVIFSKGSTWQKVAELSSVIQTNL